MLLNRVASTVAIILSLCACTPQALHAQSIAPMIAEYTDHASGSFDVTNSSLYPTIVQLEPKSFSIDVDGKGQFRALDPAIHLELSATSMRLAPRQTVHIFYKASADNVPAWLCVYASFTSIQKNPGLNVRILLPPHHLPLPEGLPAKGCHYCRAGQVRPRASPVDLRTDQQQHARRTGRAQSKSRARAAPPARVASRCSRMRNGCSPSNGPRTNRPETLKSTLPTSR